MKPYRKINLHGLELPMRIGVHASEQGREQRVRLDVDLYVREPEQPIDDQLEHVLDYDFLRRFILEVISRGHIRLQETLVDLIVERCLEEAQVLAVRVRSEKTEVYPDCKGVGFEVYREK